jgi:hypothetical protein
VTPLRRLLRRVGVIRNDPAQAPAIPRRQQRGPQPQIAIVAELSIAACKLYRVDHKARALERLGCRVEVANWWEPDACRRALQTCDLAIFYRVGLHPSTRELFDEARRLGVRTMFETDDLIFDRPLFAERPTVLARPPAEQAELLDGVDAYQAALLACDDVIASTEALAEHIRPLTRGDVFVVENVLEPAELALADSIRRDPLPRSPGKAVIGYGSGTRTHDADFAVVTPALAKILDRFPQVELALHGELDIPDELRRFGERIVQLPLLPWGDYLRAKATWDVNIAPLEASVFNDVKSTIKFLEAAVVGVPTVCSPTPPNRDLIAHGVNGFIAGTEEEWTSALANLVEHAPLRASMGREALNTALARCDPERVAAQALVPLLEALPPAPAFPRVLIVDDGPSPDQRHAAAVLAREPGIAVALFCEGDGAPYELRRDGPSVVDSFRVSVPERSLAGQYWDAEVAEVFGQVLAAWSPGIVVVLGVRRLGVTLMERCRAAGLPYVVVLEDLWWLTDGELAAGVEPSGPTADVRRWATQASDPVLAWHRYVELRGILSSAAALVATDETVGRAYRAHGIRPELLRPGLLAALVRKLAPDGA